MIVARAIAGGLLFMLAMVASAQMTPSVTAAAAEWPVVQTQVDPTSGTVGDHFKLRVSAAAPDLAALEVLPLFDTQTTWTLIGNPSQSDGKSTSGQPMRTYEYTIAPFETGRQFIPQVALTYEPVGETSNTVLSKSLWVNVGSVLSGDGSASALRGVKPPAALAVPQALVWSVSGIMFLLLALLAWWLWRRYSQRLKRLLGQALTPPDVALKKLKSLEDERLIEQKKTKEFYTRLTDAIRIYLYDAYGVLAMDLTSSEVLDVMDLMAEDESPVHLDEYRQAMARLAEVLHEADMVKFARVVPEASQCRKALQAGRDIVNFTRYRFQTDEDENRNAGPRAGRQSSSAKSQHSPRTHRRVNTDADASSYQPSSSDAPREVQR